MAEQTERILRVDMTDQTVETAAFPEEWKLLGGRALSAKILLAECDPTCDPLGPDNVLVLAPGVLAGSSAPTSGRISVGCKSPLTNGIKEANSGGNPGQHLMKLGIHAIIVKGKPADPARRFGLEVSADRVELVAADEYKGLWNYPTCEKLAASHDERASFISIGPAGELGLAGASVACTDQDNRYPTRHAARGGPGAVMGSKGLKWIAIDPGRTPVRRPADRAAFNELVKSYTKAYREGPQMFKTGTSSVVPVANMLNTFPHRNRVNGQSPHAEQLDGARIVESFEQRGGGMHNCLTGCIVQCSNVIYDADGEYKTSALEFETLTLFGSNCDLESWEDVADMDRLCDDIGLDTIETGAAIAVLMDAGEMDWGDAEGMKKLLREIADGTDLGKAVGNGAAAVGRRTKHGRVPTVHGQAIPAWDPRPLKATGVTYATSPMGADHTAGLIVNPGMQPEEFAYASQKAQLVNAVCDSSGFCQFVTPTLEDIRKFYGAFMGREITREEIHQQGWQCLQDEWEFNRRAGWDEKEDPMPECMKKDPIGPQQAVYDVPIEEANKARSLIEPQDDMWTTAATG
ncbi:MAG: aldehyde ferredoxin oxidoreductase C-terminal domain-containing protein [Myxococcota bacterium]